MKKTEFWITNISNQNISLSDLNVTIKALSSINLLDSNHYSYTLAQLEKSASQGSLYKKRNKLIYRQNAPNIENYTLSFNKNTTIPDRARSVLEITYEKYQELEIFDIPENDETEAKKSIKGV